MSRISYDDDDGSASTTKRQQQGGGDAFFEMNRKTTMLAVALTLFLVALFFIYRGINEFIRYVRYRVHLWLQSYATISTDDDEDGGGHSKKRK